MDDETLAQSQRFKAALHYAVGEICREIGETEELSFSREVVAAISETVYNFAEMHARDLEAFALHGKRKVITAEDVKLCCRRNANLLQLVNGWHENLKSKKAAVQKPPKKKTKVKTVDSDSDLELL